MKSSLFTILLMIGASVNAEEKFLECSGTWNDEGINLPRVDTPFLEKKQGAYQQFLFKDSSITVISRSPNFKDEIIRLCKRSESYFVYAGDCKITEPRRMAVDWTLSEIDNLSTDSDFHKKWLSSPNSYIGARIIYLDRVNLSLVDDEYNLERRINLSKKPGNVKLTYQNYVIVNHFRYQCKIVKSKL